MNIFTIPVRHLKRKSLRTVLLVVVFSIGILSVVTLNHVSRVVGESLEQKLTQFGANILVYPKTETLSISYGGFSLGNLSYEVKYLDENEIVRKIDELKYRKNISAIAPKLIVPAKIHGKNAGIVGVNWREELKIKSYWSMNNAPERKNALIAGRNAAERYELIKGSVVRLFGIDLVVAGILDETGAEDDNLIFADLQYLQKIAAKEGQANFVEVAALCAGCPIDEIVYDITQALPGADVRALQKVLKQRMFTVRFVERLAFTVSMVILLTACAMIGLFMLASVNERKKEIGILRSLGYSKASVFSIFCMEALFIGVISGIAGYPGGYLISFKVLQLLDMGTTTAIPFTASHFIATLLLVAGISALSSAFPAWKASRVEPSEALVML